MITITTDDGSEIRRSLGGHYGASASQSSHLRSLSLPLIIFCDIYILKLSSLILSSVLRFFSNFLFLYTLIFSPPKRQILTPLAYTPLTHIDVRNAKPIVLSYCRIFWRHVESKSSRLFSCPSFRIPLRCQILNSYLDERETIAKSL